MKTRWLVEDSLSSRYEEEEVVEDSLSVDDDEAETTSAGE